MDKKLFEKLYESMIQMNEIIDGERVPSREFVVDAVQDKKEFSAAWSECERRRKIQIAHNQAHHITPTTIVRTIHQGIDQFAEAEELAMAVAGLDEEGLALNHQIHDLETKMDLAARNLEFEKAAKLRDRIKELKGIIL